MFAFIVSLLNLIKPEPNNSLKYNLAISPSQLFLSSREKPFIIFSHFSICFKLEPNIFIS
jgi:hypothetical protein